MENVEIPRARGGGGEGASHPHDIHGVNIRLPSKYTSGKIKVD